MSRTGRPKQFLDPCVCGKPYHCKGMCKNCYNRARYYKNHEVEKARGKLAASKRRINHREAVNACMRRCSKRKRISLKRRLIQLKSNPCMDCGIVYPHYVMEFDHARGEKKFSINCGIIGYGVKLVEEEILKCDVICANCHKVRTYNRKQCYKNWGELNIE